MLRYAAELRSHLLQASKQLRLQLFLGTAQSQQRRRKGRDADASCALQRRRSAFGRQDLQRASAPAFNYRLQSSFDRGALGSVEGLGGGSREYRPGGGGGLGGPTPEQRAHQAQLSHAHAALLRTPPPGDAFRRHTVHVPHAGALDPDRHPGLAMKSRSGFQSCLPEVTPRRGGT